MRILTLALLLSTAPAAAQLTPSIGDDDAVTVAGTPAGVTLRATERAVPFQLTPSQRFQYRRVFLDIDAGRFSAASAQLDAMGRGPLHDAAEAQILLGLGVGAGQNRLLSWLERNPSAPQAPTIAGLARKAGATVVPPLVGRRSLTPVRLTPPLGPRSARGDMPGDAAFIQMARDALSAERIDQIEWALNNPDGTVADSVRTEWAQRAAWDRYIDNDDPSAIRLGDKAASGTGDWAALGNWVSGLASFRQGDCEGAARRFDSIANQFASADVKGAAAFWAARSHLRCGRPEAVAPRLEAARRADPNGFYGLLATRSLGLTPTFDWREPDFINADWNRLADQSGARRAAALVEVGQLGLADRELRQLAMTAPDSLYEPILRLAARLNLPATQYWLAQNPPAGRMPPLSARLPAPEWRPFNGWRVDRNLVFAHALQESSFITTATSRAGARGLLQLMPGTARDMARAAAMQHDDTLLTDPAFNVEYGQSFLERLRDSRFTQGLLPKVIAAYNAGLGNVQKWNDTVADTGDALLFIESIPFRETRHYVEIVMRNYWLYGLRSGQMPGSLDAVAANQWPRFPGMPGAAGITMPPRPAPLPPAPPLAVPESTTVASAAPMPGALR